MSAATPRRSFSACLCLTLLGTAAADQQKTEKAASPTVVGAGRLLIDYYYNEARADETYTTRTLEVTGMVGRIFRVDRPEAAGLPASVKYVLHMTPGGTHQSYALYFSFAASDRPALAKLNPNEFVSIRAKCEGRQRRTGELGASEGNQPGIWFTDPSILAEVNQDAIGPQPAVMRGMPVFQQMPQGFNAVPPVQPQMQRGFRAAPAAPPQLGAPQALPGQNPPVAEPARRGQPRRVEREGEKPHG
jgi:hypothetical protein